MDKKDKSMYVFNIKLISLAMCIIAIVILLVMGVSSWVIAIAIIEIVLWINLTIQEIKIKLLQEIADKLNTRDIKEKEEL